MAQSKTAVSTTLMECPVCCEIEGIPKRLPCEHTLCEACIDKMVAVGRLKAHSENKQWKNEISCPLCKKQILVPKGKAENLPTHLLMKQLQMAAMETSGTRKGKICDSCNEEGHIGDQYCKQCSKLMCTACAEMHKARKMFQNHNTIEKSLIICEKHEMDFQYLCTVCTKFLCFKCANTGICEEHECVKIQDIEGKVTDDINDIVKSVTDDIHYCKSELKPSITLAKTNILQIQETRKAIEEHTENLKKKLDDQKLKLLAEVDKLKSELSSMTATLESCDKLEILEEMKKAAEDAQKKGVEKMIMTIPIIKSQLPARAPQPDISKISETVSFEPSESLTIGKLCRVKCSWQKGGLSRGWDVVFTAAGHIAVTDPGNNKVLLYNKNGDIVADSSSQGVTFSFPFGIAYHSGEDVLVVTDVDEHCVKLLTANTLCHVRDIQLEGVYPYGVAVMSNGNLVVTYWWHGPHRVLIYNMQGRKIKEVHNYGDNGEHKVQNPFYVTVDADDNILVSMRTDKKHIAVYNRNLEWLRTITVNQEYPRGLCVSNENKLYISYSDGIYKLFTDGKNPHIDVWLKVTGNPDSFGEARSVAVQGLSMAVIYEKGLQLLQLETTSNGN